MVARVQDSFSDRLPLSRSTVDRDAATRDRPEALAAARADPGTRYLALHGGLALLAPGEPVRLALLSASRIAPDAPMLYLGRVGDDDELPAGTALFAVLLDDGAAAALEPDPVRWADLRLTGSRLDARDAGLFAEAVGLANWHRVSGFSPRTGVATVVGRGGWVRHPPEHETEASGEHVFPRTDPAVIVGVEDDAGRLLLANNVAWPADRFSLVAGFVEPGESFEAAVRREVLEETGVRVGEVVYLGSQPWPFPASIMVGFLARTAGPGEEAVGDGVEIRAARWFGRDELAEQTASGELRLPGGTSIARAIIEHWYGGPLEGDW